MSMTEAQRRAALDNLRLAYAHGAASTAAIMAAASMLAEGQRETFKAGVAWLCKEQSLARYALHRQPSPEAFFRKTAEMGLHKFPGGDWLYRPAVERYFFACYLALIQPSLSVAEEQFGNLPVDALQAFDRMQPQAAPTPAAIEKPRKERKPREKKDAALDADGDHKPAGDDDGDGAASDDEGAGGEDTSQGRVPSAGGADGTGGHGHAGRSAA